MSRVGKVPVKISQGVKVDIKDSTIKVEGPKGKTMHKIPLGITAKVENGAILVTGDLKVAPNASALQGLTRTLIYNMVHGAAVGFTKELDIVGVGYRAAVKGQTLTMNLGYSHQVEYEAPAGIAVKVENNTRVVVSGADKILVGMVAAKIRSFKKPEPYQGKGVKYVDEHIIRKQGKAAGAK
ncbi:50S ribosomal protein L6 [bacterium]|jgi:large subunit ribosomal protein L6|nr:50S ribosomal protein L6 [bacterium]